MSKQPDMIEDDKDLTGLTPKQIAKRKRMIEWYKRFGFNNDLKGVKLLDKKRLS